jgi:hypothetical protein
MHLICCLGGGGGGGGGTGGYKPTHFDPQKKIIIKPPTQPHCPPILKQ